VCLFEIAADRTCVRGSTPEAGESLAAAGFFAHQPTGRSARTNQILVLDGTGMACSAVRGLDDHRSHDRDGDESLQPTTTNQPHATAGGIGM
jgi:hypothetical protein